MSARQYYDAKRAEPKLSGWCFPGRPLTDHQECVRVFGGCPCTKQGCPCAVKTSGAEPGVPAPAEPERPSSSGESSASEPGFYEDVPEAEYHADRVSLSVSGAKTLLKSPALFRYEQDHPPFKDVWEFGSAVHALVLGRGMESIYVTPCDDWRTKAAQEERKIARAERMSPITPSEWEVASEMADALALHPIAGKLFEGGRPEVSAYAVDEATGVMRRGRFDYLRDDLIVDYKTDRISDPKEFGRTAANFGYAQQAAWYLDLAHDLGHEARGFLFVVQMKEPPYLVSVCELTHEAVQRGRELNQRALEMFRDCTESGLWPGYGDEIHSIDLPAWAYYDKQESA